MLVLVTALALGCSDDDDGSRPVTELEGVPYARAPAVALEPK
jgi:hypothetical protein